MDDTPPDYTFQNYGSQAFAAYGELFSSQLIEIRELNSMVGFLYQDGKVIEEYFIRVDTQRIKNFCSFWGNRNKTSTFFGYGEKIKQISNIDKEQEPKFLGLYNSFVIFILIFIFRSRNYDDQQNFNPRVSLFVNESAYNFSSVVLTGKAFLLGCVGIGNIRTDSNLNLPVKDIRNRMNQGFVYNYCTNIETEYYRENGYLNDDDTPSDQGIASYRQFVSNKPILASWCGCYVSLLPVVKEELVKSGIFEPINRCDSFCFQTDTYKLYRGPGLGTDPYDCNDSTVCILDKTSININSNSSNAKINFDQVCTCPVNRVCLCFLEVDPSGIGILDNISLGDNGILNQARYLQRCNITTCYTSEEGAINPVDCNTINTPATGKLREFESLDGGTTYKKYKELSNVFWISMIFVGFIVLIYILTFLEITYFKIR